ncbi:hypothetical protein [Marinobacter nauticus]|uniref:Phage tail tape measure protein n=1 Tax=Marinobacter nauticus TaxID=2743 RepID=A0A368V3K3_MARNT|nr:hypothetical protein [Marinobacter nauticus]RBP74111.1 hypothetical protein DET64_105237 [Marinobacter nauticus]RCW34860.1 hypothetical protein DET51_105236 [Marinobacter nauticus]
MADRNVTYRLRGDAGDFTRVVNRAEATLSGSFKKMQQSSGRGGRVVAQDYNRISDAAGKAEFKVKGLVTAIGGFALGGGGLTALANQAVTLADEIAKTSSRLGVTTDELQRYRFAAELSGVQTATLEMGLQRFGRRLGEAAQGAGEAKPALEALNISVRNVDGTLRPVNQVFDEAITKLSQVEDVTIRNALAMKLFDSEGVALVQIGDNIERLKKQADDLGLIIPEELLRNAENLNDQLSIVQKTLAVKLTAALLKFAPQLSAVADGFLAIANNSEAIVSALGTLAKLLVAIKLGSFIQGMVGVATASVAAAKGVNALRISLQGLKAATFVGLGLIALEIAIQKFLTSIDDTNDAITDSLRESEAAIQEFTQNTAKAYEDVSSELVQQRTEYNKNIDKLVKAEIETLEKALKAQESVVRDQKSLLKDATRDAQKAADEFKEAFDQIRGGNQKNENPDLIDFSRQITEARRLLAQGDNEGAVDSALKAKDIVLALQETGRYTEAQLAGTLKKAQEVQQAASGALVSEQEAAVQQAENALQKIQSQINLIKSISFSFDETKSLEEAQRVIGQIKSLIEKQPIVVPVELKPTNGLDVGSASAPGYASGGLIRGPGNGTSDSILARLSNGEYVIKADAVRKYGLDFLNQLNAGRLQGFASGGLVSVPKSGGSSGTPVNLSVGGRDYPMSASPQVAAQLRRETHMEQLKKGRKR